MNGLRHRIRSIVRTGHSAESTLLECGLRSLALSHNGTIQSVEQGLNCAVFIFQKRCRAYVASVTYCSVRSILLCLAVIIGADAEMFFYQSQASTKSRLRCPPQARPAVVRQADHCTVALAHKVHLLQDEVCRALIYACKTRCPHQKGYECSRTQHHQLPCIGFR